MLIFFVIILHLRLYWRRIEGLIGDELLYIDFIYNLILLVIDGQLLVRLECLRRLLLRPPSILRLHLDLLGRFLLNFFSLRLLLRLPLHRVFIISGAL